MEWYILDHPHLENIYFGKYYLLTVVPNYCLYAMSLGNGRKIKVLYHLLSFGFSLRQWDVQIFIPTIIKRTTTKFYPRFSITHPPSILWILCFLSACGFHQRGLYKVNVETIIANYERTEILHSSRKASKISLWLT